MAEEQPALTVEINGIELAARLMEANTGAPKPDDVSYQELFECFPPFVQEAFVRMAGTAIAFVIGNLPNCTQVERPDKSSLN